ncbi:unnamed protein product [Citrullus colocynthis]|uniref:Uncharacterized protein n=1 Tax=Citrullus colocynthis TaxID=252529 RepID=A0ABP0Y198_9ROSI
MWQWLISSSQMLSLRSLFNQNQRPPLIATKKCSDDVLKRRSFHSFHYSASRCCIVCARETDSQQFEVDPDKARQALQELDQQLQSFSKKQVTSPKKKVQDMELPRNQMRGEMTEISGALLANSAVVLFIFSIFYNLGKEKNRPRGLKKREGVGEEGLVCLPPWLNPRGEEIFLFFFFGGERKRFWNSINQCSFHILEIHLSPSDFRFKGLQFSSRPASPATLPNVVVIPQFQLKIPGVSVSSFLDLAHG